MIFVELTPFIAFRAEHRTDEDLRSLHAYVKNVQTDLTREQIKTLAQLMKDIKNE